LAFRAVDAAGVLAMAIAWHRVKAFEISGYFNRRLYPNRSNLQPRELPIPMARNAF
jgi:hypothetical protein